MESLIGPFIDRGKSIVTNIAGQEENQQTLMRKKDEVCARECDVKAIILQAEEEQGKRRPTEETKLWLRDVERFTGEVQGIMNQIASSSKLSKARIAQEVVRKIEEAVDLLQRGQLPNGVVIDEPRRGQEILFEPPSLSGQTTAEKTMDEIMKVLKNPNIRKIGVYGMGGVGKTTIVQNIYNKLKASTDQQQFDQIIWVTVSKDVGGIGGLQSRIASALGLTLGNQQYSCEVTRAAVLLKELKRAKRFLLVLDDLWEEISLEEIGIPNPDREGNHCKILVTTRRLPVCDFIQTHRNVEVKCLSKEEAWKLFVEKVGDHVLRVPDLTSLAREVVQELEGLPLAIITVGCAMRRAFDVKEWRRNLKALKNSRTDDGPTGMKDKVFKFLKFSFDHLTEEVQKKCFLYCALYPEDHKIEERDLLLLWVAEGYTKINGVSRERLSKKGRLAEEYDSTWDWEDDMNNGLKILGVLKDSCLLESTSDNRVQMHDLIRDMAVQIMRDHEDFYYISKAGMGLTEFPEAAWDKEATKISLMHNCIKTLPDQLSCPKLSTLLLRRHSLGLANSFFSGMHALQVLDLSFSKILHLPVSLSDLINHYALRLGDAELNKLSFLAPWKERRALNLPIMEITQLPESLSDLTNLRALFLRESTVNKIPSLAKLKELLVLDLNNSEVTQLPEGIEKLVNLRYLDFSTCYLGSFQYLRPNVIRRLARLEVLKGDSALLYHSPSYDKIIEEIGSLKRLTTLMLRFGHIELYQKAMECIEWNKLKEFDFVLGLCGFILDRPHFRNKGEGNARNKIIEICGLPSSDHFSSFLLPDQTEKLNISCWRNVPNISSFFRFLKNSRFLKCLRICDIKFEDCSLVEMSDEMEPFTLDTLEELEINDIGKVEVFWSGAMPRGNLRFTNLKKLVIIDCLSLTLFTHEILAQLMNIEVIFVDGCRQVETIEQERGESSSAISSMDQVVLPKLRFLVLQDLPLLHYVSQRVWVCNSLEHLVVLECPRLKKLPFQSLPPSVNIHGEKDWWEETLEWDSAELKSLFQPCFKGFTVGFGEKIELIFKVLGGMNSSTGNG